MKITIIFPARDFEIGKATMPVMPLAPTLLAALTPQEHEILLIDMFYGDEIDYDNDCDLVAITVRTPLAVVAYNIADKFASKGKTVVLGGPHIFAYPTVYLNLSSDARQQNLRRISSTGKNIYRTFVGSLRRGVDCL